MKWSNPKELAEQAIEHSDKLSTEEKANLVVELELEGYQEEAEQLEQDLFSGLESEVPDSPSENVLTRAMDKLGL